MLMKNPVQLVAGELTKDLADLGNHGELGGAEGLVAHVLLVGGLVDGSLLVVDDLGGIAGLESLLLVAESDDESLLGGGELGLRKAKMRRLYYGEIQKRRRQESNK